MKRLHFDRPGALLQPPGRSGVPVRVWARSLDLATVRQLERIAAQPYVVEFVAAMADAHVAEGVAVGTVFATESTVVPGALGGDLGCGVSATRLDVPSDTLDRRTLEQVIARLGRAIPTGDAVHRGAGVDVPEPLVDGELSTRSLERTRATLAPRHLGTLGGGNHFLELDRDMAGGTWLLVHSGSRGLGAAIATHHAHAAGASGLAGLDTGAEAGRCYLSDLQWALSFARANRRALVVRALDVISDVLGSPIVGDDIVDIHHNFVSAEEWFGRRLLVHRKGAVAVPAGTKAVIPGSMGTASYLVEGCGNPDAFGSCSHGAGRVLSRKAARAAISPRSLAESMRRVIYPEHLERSLVEESPAAYRDIGEVLDAQEDLVRRMQRLEPIAVLKG